MESAEGESESAGDGLWNVCRRKRRAKKKPTFMDGPTANDIPVQVVTRVPQKAAEASSNWKALSKNIDSFRNPTVQWRSRGGKSTKGTSQSLPSVENAHGSQKQVISPKKLQSNKKIITTKINSVCHYGLDCEMVGVGPMKESALARVSLVDEKGVCVYDKFVKPLAPVTDYRTEFSGVREKDLRNALDFHSVIEEVCSIVKGHIIVGHAVDHDFKALMLQHPKHLVRDTAVFFKKLFKTKTPGLKKLAMEHLNLSIQSGEHDSVEDARAAMRLYMKFQEQWEQSLKKSRQITILRSREQSKPVDKDSD